MRNIVTGASLLIAAAAVGAALTNNANAVEPNGFTQCVVAQSDFTSDVANVSNGKADIITIPAGWTPLGGSAVPKGMKYIGVIVLCK